MTILTKIVERTKSRVAISIFISVGNYLRGRQFETEMYLGPTPNDALLSSVSSHSINQL